MSRPLPAIRRKDVYLPAGGVITNRKSGTNTPVASNQIIGQDTDILYQSEGHPVNRLTGKRESGGPFHVTHTRTIMEPGFISGASSLTFAPNIFSGPVLPFTQGMFTQPIMSYYPGTVSKEPPDLEADGATAISLCAPTNPTTNLGVTLAEMMREGLPSLINIKQWENRTLLLKNAAGEYLNKEFGWDPLLAEVQSTVNTARRHRDILQNYHKNEGKNVHRRFDFDVENQVWSEDCGTSFLNRTEVPIQFFLHPAKCQLRVEKRVQKYFVGCFSYGGASENDNFHRQIGFGRDADKLYGLNLTPNVLWEATPWSWAIDWFTNTGDVINNITNFASAGLVMRYGYMMCETTHRAYVTWDDIETRTGDYNPQSESLDNVSSVFQGGGGRLGFETVEKSRVPANPFGFGIGWEDLSPTQLAIAAAIGITRLL